MAPDVEPVQQTLLGWMFTALGFPYVIVLPLAGFLCFLLALVVVLRGNGPMAAALGESIASVPNSDEIQGNRRCE